MSDLHCKTCGINKNAPRLFEAANAYIDELERQTQWQPIETAPKDGDVDESGCLDSVMTYPHFRVISFSTTLKKWVEWSGYYDELMPVKPQPTHWMPLPKPPQTD